MPVTLTNCRHLNFYLLVKGTTMKQEKQYNKILKEIGEHLTRLREKSGYATLKEFSRQYDLPEIQYWRMEKGKANITLKSLMKILWIHKVSMQDFFCSINKEKV